MALLVYCHICFSSHSISFIKVFPSCGHGVCHSCLKNTVEHYRAQRCSRPPCPMCRKPFHPEGVISLFLDPPNSNVSQSSSQPDGGETDAISRTSLWEGYSEEVELMAKEIARRAEGIRVAGEDEDTGAVRGGGSSSRSVKQIGGALRDMLQLMGVEKAGPGVGEEPIHVMLGALAGLVDRVAPLFSRSSQVFGLRKMLDHTTQQSKTLERQVESLMKELGRQEDLLVRTSEMAERAKNQVEDERSKNKSLTKLVQSKESEVAECKKTILAHKEHEKKQKQKREQMKQQIEDREAQIRELQGRLEQSESTQLNSPDGRWQDQPYGETQGISEGEEDEDDPCNVSEFCPPPLPPAYCTRPFGVPALSMRPTFSEWSLQRPLKRPRLPSTREPPQPDPNAELFGETLGLNREGRVAKGAIQLGDRRTYRFT